MTSPDDGADRPGDVDIPAPQADDYAVADPDAPPAPEPAPDPAPPEPAPSDPDPTLVRVYGPDHHLLDALADRDAAVTRAREVGGYIIGPPAMAPAEQAGIAMVSVHCPGVCERQECLYAASAMPDDVDGDVPFYEAVQRAAGCLEDPPVCHGVVAAPEPVTAGPLGVVQPTVASAAQFAAVQVTPTASTAALRATTGMPGPTVASPAGVPEPVPLRDASEVIGEVPSLPPRSAIAMFSGDDPEIREHLRTFGVDPDRFRGHPVGLVKDPPPQE